MRKIYRSTFFQINEGKMISVILLKSIAYRKNKGK